LKAEYTDIATLPVFSLGEFRFKWLFLFAIIFGIIFYILYNKTRYGKYMYAIGGNESAAEVAGVNVNKMKLKIYALAGIMYGIAGFILAAKSGGASVNLGMGYELEAIAACTIGGVSTNGGVGKVSGILLGVLVFELLKTSMQFIGIDTSLQYVVQGIVIVVAVAIDIRKYIVKK
jgi:methyl-galactoside transport system permease protein